MSQLRGYRVPVGQPVVIHMPGSEVEDCDQDIASPSNARRFGAVGQPICLGRLRANHEGNPKHRGPSVEPEERGSARDHDQ